VPASRLHPATYLSKGKVEEIAGLVKSFEAGIVVMDCALTPVQQRNLEKVWNAKVLDRTVSFWRFSAGAHARAKARCSRARAPNLSERQAGADLDPSRAPARRLRLSRWPGETQLEADRRIIEERLAKIEGELVKVKRTRALHRESRRRVPYPMSRWSATPMPANRPCSTDDASERACPPTCCSPPSIRPLRGVALPHGARASSSPTRSLHLRLADHSLVAAFRATLEEVVEADVILHVRDVSHEDAEAQLHDVEKILRELGIDPHDARTSAS